MKVLNCIKHILYVLFLSLFLATSCSNQSDDSTEIVQHIRIDKENISIGIGKKINLGFSAITQGVNRNAIKWISENPSVASVEINADKTCTVKGISAGTTIIKAWVENTNAKSQCSIEVTDDGIVRILAIGNSFSEDAVENYLYDLAKAAGKTVIIGNMYIPGCSLETHLDNATNDAPAYSYRRIDENGTKVVFDNYSISKVLDEENWNYISLQQVSQNSGQYETYEKSLPGLYNYVKTQAANENLKIMLHQTWAYQQNSTHSGFANYQNNQTTMYNSIMSATEKASKLIGVDLLIPSGTAIQNGRTSLIGDNFCKDGYHLNESYGRFTAACTWFEKIFNIDVTTITYKPSTVSNYYAEIAKTAAHAAIIAPYEVTELTQYQRPEPIEIKNPVYINFNKELGGLFNGLVNFKDGSIQNLVDNKGNNTGALIKVTQPFSGGNDLGTVPTTVEWITDDASKYAFFGDISNPKGELIISNLLKNKAFIFTFFASRKGVSDNRETSYKVIGEMTETVSLDASSNASNVVSTSGIKPDANGNIRIEIFAGSNNNNGSKYYYINTMKLSPVN